MDGNRKESHYFNLGKENSMKEFLMVCLPFMSPALFIILVALTGRVFNIKKIKESHRF